MRTGIVSCARVLLLVESAVGLKSWQITQQHNKSSRDPFSAYDGLSLLKVTACNSSSISFLSNVLLRESCRFLSEPGELVLPLRGGCASGSVACGPQATQKLAELPGVLLLVVDKLGEHLRRAGAVSLTKPYKGNGFVDFKVGEPTGQFFDHFRDYDDIMARVEKLVQNSGGLAELVRLDPATAEGRHLVAVRLRGPGWKPGSPRALFTYLLHAREWISAMAGVWAVEQTIAEARHRPDFVRNMEVVFVPVSNPDGFVFSTTADRYWRKNRARGAGCDGVDLNRNFDFQWNIFKDNWQTCSETYAGLTAASEPETRALQGLIVENALTVHIDFHSCGGFVLGPWSYTTASHPRLPEILELGGEMQKAIHHSHGTDYEFCVGNSCLYPVAGDLPDYSTNSGALGFTVEMRPVVGLFASLEDFAPDASLILPNAQENFGAVKAALRWASGGS